LFKLHIVGWSPSVQVVSVIQLIRPYGHDLLSAKRAVEGLLAGHPVELNVQSETEADQLRVKLESLGCKVT
jgi:ribosomal protein L7/L12